MEETDKTIHSLIDNLLSFENDAKFLIILPEKRIGCFLEKHSESRIIVITSNSSIESPNEKLLVIVSEKIKNYNFHHYDLIILYDEKYQFSEYFWQNNDEIERASYILLIK